MSKVKRHDQFRQKLSELCDLLPFPDEIKSTLDSQAILRLVISTLNTVKKNENRYELVNSLNSEVSQEVIISNYSIICILTFAPTNKRLF